MHYDENCSKCERLSDFLKQTKAKFPTYFCKPVPSFGDQNSNFLIVGLAPGMHGANQTGRPFTGDYAGILLYETLYQFGFSSQKVSECGDGLKLINCKITNAVKCLPPENKPTTHEINTCNTYLREEISDLPSNSIILALGAIAHNAILKALNLKKADYKFAHGCRHELINGLILYDSYHCSRYNTQTRRLTETMFKEVFSLITKERET
jgi:uracil-DNA glycosylase family 4